MYYARKLVKMLWLRVKSIRNALEFGFQNHNHAVKNYVTILAKDACKYTKVNSDGEKDYIVFSLWVLLPKEGSFIIFTTLPRVKLSVFIFAVDSENKFVSRSRYSIDELCNNPSERTKSSLGGKNLKTIILVFLNSDLRIYFYCIMQMLSHFYELVIGFI